MHDRVRLMARFGGEVGEGAKLAVQDSTEEEEELSTQVVSSLSGVLCMLWYVCGLG